MKSDILYPRRFRQLWSSPDIRRRYAAFKAISSDDYRVLDRLIFSLFENAVDFRNDAHDLNTRMDMLEVERNKLHNMRRGRSSSDFTTNEIDKRIEKTRMMLSETSRELSNLRDRFIESNREYFSKLESALKRLEDYPQDAIMRLMHHVRLETPMPERVYSDAVQIVIWLHIIHDQLEKFQVEKNFNRPDTDGRPDWYKQNESVPKEFMAFWTHISKVASGFMLREPLPDDDMLAALSRSTDLNQEIDENKNIQESIRQFLQYQYQQVTKLQDMWENLRSKYPDLVAACPEYIRTKFERTLMVPPKMKNKPFEVIDRDYSKWFYDLQQAGKDMYDFSKMYTSVKALYPFTKALRARTRSTGRRDENYQLYVDSLNTLLDDALAGKSLSAKEVETMKMIARFYPNHPKVIKAIRHQGVL